MQKPPDPEAGLAVRIHSPNPRDKKVTYFWGYRNPTVTDAESELPLWEQTHPADLSEVTCAGSLLRGLKPFPLDIEFVITDAEYDTEAIVQDMVEEPGAQPMVAHNPRSEQTIEYSIRDGQLYCAAGLPMAHRGKMTPKATGITYGQYSCPMHWRKNFPQPNPLRVGAF